MVDVATKRTRKSLIEYLTQHRSPSAIAAGTSFGVVLGLIPKDSLLALVLLAAILFLSVNQIVACVFAVGLTAFSGWTMGTTHAIGSTILQSDLIANVIVSLYKLPLVPWLRLENTVVVGGLTLGIVLWLPTYLLSLRFCNKVREIVKSEQLAELAAASIRHHRDPSNKLSGTVIDQKFGLIALPEKISVANAAAIEVNVTPQVQSQPTVALDRNSKDEVTRIETQFESIAQKVDSLADDTVLTETLIEVVRYKHPRRGKLEVDSPMTHHNTTNSMKLASSVSVEIATSPRTSDSNTKFHAPSTTATHAIHPSGKEESLRHILKHIHVSRETKKETGKPA